jgi:hypothetical protein
MNETALDHLAIDGEVTVAGRLREEARAVATQRSLPLLATYVADAPTWLLTGAPSGVDTEPAETDDLGGFIGMRVALAAGRELDRVLRRVVVHASFHYARHAEESVGAVRGQLDIPRYVQTRLRPEAPRRYPVRVLRRRYATPENTLATFSALWVLRALESAPLHLLPAGAPERAELMERRTSLANLVHQPALQQATNAAAEVRRRGTINRLVDDVDRRLATGRIAAADRYQDLLAWTRRFNPHNAVPVPGSVEWLFYDSRFDPKLFEIWTLALLLDELTARLGPPASGPAPLYERTRTPIATWRLGSATISLHFQASLAKLVGESRWSYVKPTTGPLRGFPDIAAVITRVDGARRVVLIDPKLRERTSSPAEELYKLLGYFANLGLTMPSNGAIVFYAPGDPRTYELSDGRGGRVLAIGADPTDSIAITEHAAELADVVLDTAGISAEQAAMMVTATALTDPEAAAEAVTAVVQKSAIDTMVATATTLPHGTLDPIRKITSATLHAIWDEMSDAAATMIVTAEYFGQTAPADADHSGPLLGLAATCERVLYDRVFSHAVTRDPMLFTGSETFGTLLHHLADATRPSPRTPEGHALKLTLATLANVNIDDLRGLLPDLRTLNVAYRIPAAHRDLVAQQDWVAGRAHILSAPDGVLLRLVSAVTVASA